ncbi:hypothetical protein T484DRAFT_1876682 [Baffinella frigidus]|nr:hypothetical protein T484DRAFT_1876682 [Cryptophyta sp. CCMP2293]|mmetsp:Transcript_24275/g.57870  ORF Transcript_24275/g.57870 Transcript_24275/m.57870 type:complete len:158 (+) Transcript_24275:28-501(+)
MSRPQTALSSSSRPQTAQSFSTRPRSAVSSTSSAGATIAKQDALQWTNQRNLRVLLEHLTSKVLEAEPDDPLHFTMEHLAKLKEDAEGGAAAGGGRPATAQARPQSANWRTPVEAQAAAQKERDEWKELYDEQAATSANLQDEINELLQSREADVEP